MLTEHQLALGMVAGVFGALLSGYPVAMALGGTALLFAALGSWLEVFDSAFLLALPNRIYGIMTNETLVAVPLFVFMGAVLERARIAEDLLDTMAELFGSLRGGLGLSVTTVGALMAASTGIVGATVVTMGLLSLPTMLKRGYHPALACGTICASGTLGQIIPPSIVLVLLGDVIGSAYSQAQLDQGVFNPKTVSVGDLFAGALLPGLGLVLLYLGFLAWMAWLKPSWMPALPTKTSDHRLLLRVIRGLIPPLFLMVAVLGSILGGLATPTEAAAVGAVGALFLAALRRKLDLICLREVMQNTTRMSSMVFLILIGAALFSLVFRGFYGDEMVVEWLAKLPGGAFGAMASVMAVMFGLGFVLDFIEITFMVVPLVGPMLLGMGLDPVWLGVMIALNLQTSFLTPPFGFALFYLRGVAPPQVSTADIYLGVVPFIAIQLLMLGIVAVWPQLATWLPSQIYAE
jgi:tripartite ATP-independent transporter DctM subunit